ncbi:MAG: hypothetical protein AAGA99_25450 [Actinomycetota bacterium]
MPPAADVSSTTTVENLALPALPTSADPCVTPAAHRVGRVAAEYGFEFDGEVRPVGIRMLDPVPSQQTVWVVLHGAGLTWHEQLGFMDDVIDIIGDESATIIVPQASGQSPFWSASPTFNPDYVGELFRVLEQSICLDGGVVLAGTGQGTLAAAQAYCEAELPIDALYFNLGMVKMEECAPAEAVPLFTLDVLEFVEGVGNHWDGSWDPPVQLEQALTGGIRSTPEDLSVWAELYGCADDAVEETSDVASEFSSRQTIKLSHRDCAAPIVAYGVPSAAFEQPTLFGSALAGIRDELVAVLGP